MTGSARPPGLARGDSGGGAVVNFSGRWYLYGVVSVALDGGKLYAFSDVRKHFASDVWFKTYHNFKEILFHPDPV